MPSSATALPDDVDTLKAMLVAIASEKAGLETEAGQFRDETAELKAEIVGLRFRNELPPPPLSVPQPQEIVMGSTTDRIKGTANEVAGKAKQAAGDMTDNDRMKAEGAGQEAKGKVQESVGKAKDAVKKTIDKL